MAILFKSEFLHYYITLNYVPFSVHKCYALIYASFFRILSALAIASLALACCSAKEWA